MILTWIKWVNQVLWTLVLPISLVGLSSYMMIRLRLQPLRRLKDGLRVLKSRPHKEAQGDLSPIAALSLALGATLGMGNIVGVLFAIRIGGPGALFWMWVVGLMGMSLKYAETILSVKYRQRDPKGQLVGGSMYYLEHGVGAQWLGKLFAATVIIAVLAGIGTFPQVHSIVDVFTSTFDVPTIPTAIGITLLVAYVSFGGLQRTSAMTLVIIPSMVVLLLMGSVYLLLLNASAIPMAFRMIFQEAFAWEPLATGGGGYGIKVAIDQGLRRGIFSNESGMGSAPIAAASGRVRFPAEQGSLHMLEVLLDTLVINTLTGLVFITSGAYQMAGSESQILNTAYRDPLGLGRLTLTVSLIFFALTSIIVWSYYGAQCAGYLFGHLGARGFRLAFVVVIFLAGFVGWNTTWAVADFATAMMVLPNLVGVFLLRREVLDECKRYERSKSQSKTNA